MAEFIKVQVVASVHFRWAFQVGSGLPSALSNQRPCILCGLVIVLNQYLHCTHAGCVPGFVDLVGGVREREGAVRVCMNGNRVPVSATGLSILEASLLCRESGLGQGRLHHVKEYTHCMHVGLLRLHTNLMKVLCPLASVVGILFIV